MDTQEPKTEPARFQGTHEGSGGAVKVPDKPAPSAGMLVKIEGGLMKPETFAQAWDLALMYVRSGMLPKAYTKPEQVVTAMQYAAELGIYGLVALRQIAIINGTPSIFGDLPLALVRSKGQLESLKETYIDRNGKEITAKNGNLGTRPYAAICITKRKNTPEPVETYFTEDEAKQAGLLGKGGPWTQYYKTMLKMRARSMNLKDSFGDALNGVSIAEYDFHMDERTLTENPIQTVLADGTARAVNPGAGVDVAAVFGSGAPAAAPEIEDAVIVKMPDTAPDALADLGDLPQMSQDQVDAPDSPPADPAPVDPFPVKAKAGKAKKETKMDPDEPVLSYGRFTGQKCSEMDGGDISAFFFTLKSEVKRRTAAAEEVPATLAETLGIVEKFLAIKK